MISGTPRKLIAWLVEQPQDKVFDIKEHRERRSLTQNAYYWAMLNKLAAKLGMGDGELHFHMLREYGVCDVFSVLEDVPFRSYFRYSEKIGEGEVNGKKFNHIKVYKGSSKMDSKEFTRLVDGMRQECELQGIDVKTPEEIAALEFIEPTGKDDQ